MNLEIQPPIAKPRDSANLDLRKIWKRTSYQLGVITVRPGTGIALLGAMNLSIIAFGVMTGFVALFAAAIFLMERSSSRVEFPKPDIAETEEDNPFKVAD